MVQRPPQLLVLVEVIIVQSVNWYTVIKTIVTMSSLIMEMIVLVGVKQQQLHGLLTVTMLAMLDSLFGLVLTILVSLRHGTIKIIHQSKVLILVL